MSRLPVLNWIFAVAVLALSGGVSFGQDVEEPLEGSFVAEPLGWDRTAFQGRVRLSYESNSNIIYSTEARGPVPNFEDDVGEAGIRLGLFRDNLGGSSWRASYGLQLEHPNEFTTLRALDHNLLVNLTLDRDGPRRWDLELAGRYYDFYNFRPWSFFQGHFKARATQYFQGGFVLEAGALGALRKFTDDVQAPLDYSVIDYRRFGGEFTLKRWLSPILRLRGGYVISATRFDPTTSTFLGERSNLDPTDARWDVEHRLDGHVLLNPSDVWSVSAGYEFRFRRSNGEYYSFRGHFLSGYAVYMQFGGTLRASALWGVVDFFDRQFDPRFLNTREDFRALLNVSYSRLLTSRLGITGSYSFVSNDSNDSEGFDPATTLSYGDVEQQALTIALDYSFDGEL